MTSFIRDAFALNNSNVLKFDPLLQKVDISLNLKTSGIQEVNFKLLKVLAHLLNTTLLGWYHDIINLRHLNKQIFKLRKVFDRLLHVQQLPERKEPVLLRCLYFELVLVKREEHVLEFSRHFHSDILVMFYKGLEVIYACVLLQELVVHVSDTHFQHQVILLQEVILVKIAKSVRRIDLHVLGQFEAK